MRVMELIAGNKMIHQKKSTAGDYHGKSFCCESKSDAALHKAMERFARNQKHYERRNCEVEEEE